VVAHPVAFALQPLGAMWPCWSCSYVWVLRQTCRTKTKTRHCTWPVGRGPGLRTRSGAVLWAECGRARLGGWWYKCVCVFVCVMCVVCVCLCVCNVCVPVCVCPCVCVCVTCVCQCVTCVQCVCLCVRVCVCDVCECVCVVCVCVCVIHSCVFLLNVFLVLVLLGFLWFWGVCV